MSWSDVENAVHLVVTRASGLDPDRVTWSYQSVNETEFDHIVINFGAVLGIGVDRIKTTQNLSRPNGQEIMQEVRGVREVSLDLEAYTSAVTGDAAARQLLETVRSKLRLESNIFELRRVQMSIFDASAPVQWVPYIPSARFRGRATLNLRCYIPVMDAREYVGYIARVRGYFYPTPWTGPSGSSGVAFDSASGASGFGL